MAVPPRALVDLAADQVAVLRAFLAEQLPEGPNLDYKREPAQGLARTVAAMANTDGGVILIGVDEDPKRKTPVDNGGTTANDLRGSVMSHLWRYLEPMPNVRINVIEAEDGHFYGVVLVEPSLQRAVLHSDNGLLVRHGDMSVAPNRADFERLLAREGDRRDRQREIEERRREAVVTEASPVLDGGRVTVFAFLDPIQPPALNLGPEIDRALRATVNQLFGPHDEFVTAPGESVVKGAVLDYFRLSDTGELFARVDVSRGRKDWPPEGPDAVHAIDIATDLVSCLMIPFELQRRDPSLATGALVATAGVAGYADKQTFVTNVPHAVRRPVDLARMPRIVSSAVLLAPADAIPLARRALLNVARSVQVDGTYDWLNGLGARVVMNAADGALEPWKSQLQAAE